MARQRSPGVRHRPRVDSTPQGARDGSARDHAFVDCRACSAQPAAVADSVDTGHARLAIRVALRDQVTALAVEIVPAAQGTQQFVGRHEAIAHQDRIDLEAALVEPHRERLAGWFDACWTFPIEEWDAAPAQL